MVEGIGSASAREGTETVLVVDDHRTFVELLALALADLEGFDCVGGAYDAATARDLDAELQPDIVIMDVELGHDDGIALTAELIARRPELRVVVLTAHANRTLITRAAEAGACALLPKDGSLPSVVQALRWARPHSFVVDPSLLQTLVREAPGHKSTAPSLSDRESDVLGFLAQGVDAQHGARELGISVHTFRGHIQNLLIKLDAHSQLEAVAVAKREGLLG